MPTLQNLKKKLRGIRTTQKISKAMKTASTVKYSKINAVYAGYSEYEEQLRRICSLCGSDFFSPNTSGDDAHECLIVIASNKGMCGGFNSEVLAYAEEVIKSSECKYQVFICGKQAKNYFDEKKIAYDRYFLFEDVPAYCEIKDLFNCVYGEMTSGNISDVKFVYPEFKNMLKQEPVLCRLFDSIGNYDSKDETMLFIPDRWSVFENLLQKIIGSVIYKKILETALGAQAATLMMMRSAYDTATDYCAEIESQINRKRQSQVTADIIETSAEHSQSEEENANV